jgi:hypothetical protein
MNNIKLSLPAGSRAHRDRALFVEIVICMNLGLWFALAAWAVLP